MARLLAAFFLCLAAVNGEQLPARIYSTADGLANSTIDRIVTDSKGFVWFCTRDGISCFDGYRFRSFGAGQGLASLSTDLLETAGGDYWVATENGVAHFRPSAPSPKFDYYSPAETKARRINALSIDPAGGIWVGTEGGLYHLDRLSGARHLRLVDIGMPKQYWEDTFVNALLTGADGSLWVGSGSGLYHRYPNGRCERPRIDAPRPYVISLLEDREGGFWAGMRSGLCRIAASGAGRSSQDVCVSQPEFQGLVVQGLLESRLGEIWVAATDRLGIYRQPGGRGLETYFVGKQLPGRGPITTVGTDPAGNVWVGAYGAEEVAAGGFRTYTREAGLDSDHVLSILQTQAGELCVVTEGGQVRPLNCFDGRRFHPIRPNVPRNIRDWGWSTKRLTFQARSGEWWVPTGRGVFRFPAGGIDALSRNPKAVYAPGEQVYAIFEDSHGAVWISTQISAPHGGVLANSLSRWDPATGNLTRFPDNQPVPSQVLATTFAEDRSGNVWIGLNSDKLLRYRAGRFERVLDRDPGHAWIAELHVDQSGRLWAATAAGLLRIDHPESPQPQAVRYTVADGLSTDRLRCITEDPQGRLYVGSDLGVDRVSTEDKSLRIRHYTVSDGLASGDILTAFRDQAGILWFGATQGLSRLDPVAEQAPIRPPVLISGMRVRGAPLPVSFLGESSLGGIELPPERNQVELQFVGLGFGVGGALRYQYRFENQDWSPPTTERSVNYANLAPDAYQWEVRAITPDGIAGPPAAASFTILPPVWQRWWMRLLLLLAALVVFYIFYRYRLNSVVEVERLRTRIATDLHDDIGSSLSQIALLSEVARRRPAAPSPSSNEDEPLTDIANLSRDLVDSMSDIVWAIDPEQDRIGDLAHRMRRFASDLFSRDGIELRLDMPAEGRDLPVGADIRRQVFLIFKESLHNALRHSGCTRVEVRLKQGSGLLDLSVTDNGRGFDPAASRRGHGLVSMRARAAELGGGLTVDSAPGQGTSIRLRLPLANSPHNWVVDSERFRRMVRRRG